MVNDNLERAISELRSLPPLCRIPSCNTGAWDQHERLVDFITQCLEDHRYINARNKLVPLAEKCANEEVGKDKSAEWTRSFLGHMDRLWKIK